MNQPGLEVADLVRRFGDSYVEKAGGWIPDSVRRAFQAIADCRTAALGGHLYACDACGVTQPRYNSCRNRHCPKCQGKAREQWLEARCADLLPVEYFHVVFTVPDKSLHGAFRGDPRGLYNVLFQAASETLASITGDPKHLGAEVGWMAILHTWGQQLQLHPHLHCVVTGGGLSPDGQWVSCRPGFFLPVLVLADRFRNRFLALLEKRVDQGKIRLPTDLANSPSLYQVWLDELRSKRWVVYAKPPFGGPEQVLSYLGRYTHRVAISNARLLELDGEIVTYRWKDYRDGDRWKVSGIEGVEFLRRLAQHILPRGFVRIRYYGLLSNRKRKECLARCRELLDLVVEIVEKANAEESECVWQCPECNEGTLMPAGGLARQPEARFHWGRAPP